MTTGRRAGYKIMKNANKYLCIDIGGTAIKYGIFTDETECLMKNQITTPPYMQEFTACMEDICSTAQKKYDKLCGDIFYRRKMKKIDLGDESNLMDEDK